MRKKLLGTALFLATFFSIPLNAEVDLGVVAALVGEHYGEPSLVVDELDSALAYSPIEKMLVSLMPQFIWKEGRNMVLLNMEIFGSLGSLDGSFGNEGEFKGQLKIDSFARMFWPEEPFYLKFGKYRPDLPRDFGAFFETGLVEIGVNEENWQLGYSAIFQNWFKKTALDGEVDYTDERYHEEDELGHLLAFNYLLTDYGSLKPRLLVFHDTERVGVFPSFSWQYFSDSFDNLTFIGYGWNNEAFSKGVFAFREEFSLYFWQRKLKTSFLLGLMSGQSDSSANYASLSLDNKDFESQYGSHFSYLYRQAANLHGHFALGLRADLDLPPISAWLGSSVHLTSIFGEQEVKSIGYLFSGGFKWLDLFSNGSLFEVYISWFVPGSLSEINNLQYRYNGLQFVVKFQQIIF